MDKSVLVVVSNSLEQYGCFEAALAQRLRREVLRPCVARLRFPGGSAAGTASRGGPLSDTVLSAQSSLGALCPELFQQMAWQESSRGRLFARRLHLEQGTPSPERWSLSAKSIPAFVSSHLDSAITSTRGRLVGHRTVDDETFLPSVLADHDRSQHAERQALLSLVEEALDEGLDPAGDCRLPALCTCTSARTPASPAPRSSSSSARPGPAFACGWRSIAGRRPSGGQFIAKTAASTPEMRSQNLWQCDREGEGGDH
ncbi:unnamed protein product [Effrenium voratum]|nr:unnamed protein product [Effrenium voratum]